MREEVRFYLDEHVGHVIAEGLRRRGIDVLTLVEADMLGADDLDHVVLARLHDGAPDSLPLIRDSHD